MRLCFVLCCSVIILMIDKSDSRFAITHLGYRLNQLHHFIILPDMEDRHALMGIPAECRKIHWSSLPEGRALILGEPWNILGDPGTEEKSCSSLPFLPTLSPSSFVSPLAPVFRPPHDLPRGLQGWLWNGTPNCV